MRVPSIFHERLVLGRVLFEGDRRFDIIVRLPERPRNDMTTKQELPIPFPMTNGNTQAQASYVRLGDLAIVPYPIEMSFRLRIA